MDKVKFFLQKNNLKFIFTILLCATLIFATIFIIKPKGYGDGTEYMLMTESFVNHLSFDQRPEDVDSLASIAFKSNSQDPQFLKEYAGGGYYQSKNGSLFSYHFWFYPLISSPAKIFLRIIHQDEMKVFQVTNAFLFSVLITFVAYFFRKSKYFYLIIGVILFTPAFWYIHWTHPEVFSFVFSFLAILLLIKKRFTLGILLSALASTQNPPILFLAFFIALIGLYNSKFILKENLRALISKCIRYLVAGFPILIPYFFYYFYFGTFNLIVAYGHSDFKLVSVQRVLELFFDPNIGILAYSPILTILGISTVIHSIYFLIRFKKANLEILVLIGLFLVLVAEFTFSSSTLNWNSGTTGPSRYTIWSAIPIFLGIIYLGKRSLFNNFKLRFINGILITSLAFGFIITVAGGFLQPVNHFGSAAHSIPARAILTLAPQFYNPTPMIFEGRSKKISEDIYIYRTSENSKCKKALVNNLVKNSEQIRLLCGDYVVNTCYDLKCYVSF